jgi:hypothetical protein
LDTRLKSGEIEEINNRIKDLEAAASKRDKDIEEARKILDIKTDSPELRIHEFEVHLQSYKMQMENDSKELESLRTRKAALQKENSRASLNNWTMATVLYVVIGSMLAAFLAPTPATQNGELVLTDVWQVIVWGGGWVAFVSLADFGKLDANKKKIWTETIGEYEKEVGKKAAEANAAADKANKVLAQNEKLKALVKDYKDILEKMKTQV